MNLLAEIVDICSSDLRDCDDSHEELAKAVSASLYEQPNEEASPDGSSRAEDRVVVAREYQSNDR